MTDDEPSLELAIEYHQQLPLRVRDYLNRRGLLDYQIEQHLLGHNGERITIPVRNRDGAISQFRLARDPNDLESAPKMLSTPGSSAELYGWEWVAMEPDRLVVCEGEFDRLVLERYGFPAVTSTGGAGVFREEWAAALRSVPEILVCFDRDEAGRQGARRVGGMLIGSRVIELPEAVGPGGDVTDFFVRLGAGREDFLELIEAAEPAPEPEERVGDRTTGASTSAGGSETNGTREVDRLKDAFRLEDFVRRYLPLRRSGQNWVGTCPFHDDHNPSFTVYPDSQRFYCFGCQASGDVIEFLQRMEEVSFTEALEILRQLDA